MPSARVNVNGAIKADVVNLIITGSESIISKVLRLLFFIQSLLFIRVVWHQCSPASIKAAVFDNFHSPE